MLFEHRAFEDAASNRPTHLADLRPNPEFFTLGRGRYGGDAFSPMIVRLLEDALGIALRAPGFPPTLEPPEEDGAQA